MQLTYPSYSDLVVKSSMIRAAQNVYLLADSSKFDNSSFASLGRISLVDTVISDDNVPESYRLKLKELGVGLL